MTDVLFYYSLLCMNNKSNKSIFNERIKKTVNDAFVMFTLVFASCFLKFSVIFIVPKERNVDIDAPFMELDLLYYFFYFLSQTFS